MSEDLVTVMVCAVNRNARGKVERVAPYVRRIARNAEGSCYEALSCIVGGGIECIQLDNGIDLWCNEEHAILDLPLNRVIEAYAPTIPEGFDLIIMDARAAAPGKLGEWRLHGDFVLSRSDENGRTTSLTDADIERLRALFVPSAVVIKISN